MNELVNKIRVEPTASAGEAMRILDQGAVEIALVIDDDGGLLGTVTDGDLRRSILKGQGLEEPVTGIMNQNPITADSTSSRKQLLDIMQLRGIHHLPLLDEERKVVALAVLEELVQAAGRDNCVIIMAGGIGERLRPLTDQTPKPLLTIGDRPLLEIIIEQLHLHGFRRIFLSINYHSDKIRDYFQDGSPFGVDLRYLEEEEPLGTAGSLRLARDYLQKPFIVMNGDLLTQLNFGNLLAYHERKENEITACLRQYDLQIPYGVAKIEEDQLSGIEEKPEIKYFVNAGIYVMEPGILDLLPAAKRYDMTELINQAVNQQKRVGRFIINEYWLDIGQLKDYERANREYPHYFGKTDE